MKLLTTSLAGALIAYVAYTWGALIHRTLTVLGVLRWDVASTHTNQADSIVTIPDTTHCEDIHHHAPSNLLFTACEDDPSTRFVWFPPLGTLDDPELAARSRGSIHVIDPTTMESRRLAFQNFDGPFVTHGIDVISDLDRPEGEAVYIFAVNHVPNPTLPPSFVQGADRPPKARSQIEIFHHVIGSSSLTHLRSVWHPLIRTPNDVLALNPHSFYVTNDHFYRERGLMRIIEELNFNARWTDLVHIQLDPSALSSTDVDLTAGVTATVAVPEMHNCNGLGHGRSPWEMVITGAVSGEMFVGEIASRDENHKVDLVDRVEVDAVADNPTYFADPFAAAGGDDRSGFLLPGLAKAINIAKTARDPDGRDPVMVWFVRPQPGPASGSDAKEEPVRWEKRLLFSDDGSRIRTASGSVLVAIDPATTGGERKAWLFVTGFASKNVIAVKVDL